MANSQTITLMLKAIGDFSDVTSNVKQVQSVLNQIKVPKNLQENFTDIFDNLTAETKKYQKFLDSGFKKKSDVTGLEASGARINNLLKRLKVEMGKISQEDLTKSFQIDPSKLQKLSDEAKNLQSQLQAAMSTTQIQNYTNAVDAAAKEMAKVSKTDFAKNFADAFKKGDLEGARAALADINKQTNRFKNGSDNFNKYSTGAKAMEAALKGLVEKTNIEDLTQKIKDNQQAMQGLGSTELNAFIKAFQDGKITVEQFTGAVRGLTTQQRDSAYATHQQATELDQLKSRVKYFFSLTNGVQLFKRAVTSALNTVKELDKTMTEAAVVTDFSVGDMWEKLPQYSQEAQKLGISINGMYQATTLYYQQGLKTNEAMALGTETMKMGKIAAMDSTEATKAMTAALRGFNMELNETSATRVNDVYSQLAAVTAADTNQIATAMEKTASIAASANMEFETTAALLAQIIETTQEAPETAGTALKTIIARFSEVKSLRERGEATGEDEEGEAIDVNKIQAALRTVGISMEGFFAGTEGLDSILLKLAEKWEHLDFETQRYIATMAAGSRQQSRFIAMMSDYGRTVELVGEAQNSAGASQRQFEKTQESLETALARLSNAWNQFLMGLANNEVLKTAINSLTTLIETLNKLLTFVSGGSSGLKSVVSLLTTIATLKMGKNLISGGGVLGLFGIKNLKNQGAKDGKQYEKGFSGTFKRMGVGFKGLFGTVDDEGLKTLKQDILTDPKLSLDQTQQDAILGAKNFNQLSTEVKKYNDHASAAGKTTIDLKQAMDGNQVPLKTNAASFQQLGSAMMMTGMATGLLGGLFESLGWEEGAKAAQWLSIALTGLGTVFTVVSMAANVFKTSIAEIIVPIMIVVGALGLLILLLSSFFGKSPLEKEVENATNAAEAAANAAKEAKQAYDELLSGHQDYDELQKGLEDLVQGTNEWRDALLAANDQVLELLKTYPELYQYLGTGKYGQLTITEEGWQEVERLALEKRERTSASLAAANLRQADAVYRNTEETMRSNIGLNPDQFSRLEKAFRDGNKEVVEKFRKELGEDKISKMAEYIQYVDRSQKEIDTLAKTLLSTSASDELLGYDFSQALFSGAAQNYNTNKGVTGTNWFDALGKYVTKNGDEEEVKPLLEHYNISGAELEGLGGYLEKIQYIYKKVMNVDEIDEKIAENESELLQAIVQVYATEQSQGILEELAKNLSKKDKATQGKLTAVLSGDTGFASLASQQGFLDLDFDEFLSDIGMTEEQLAAYWGVDTSELPSTFYRRKGEIQEAYKGTFSDPDLYGMGDLLETQITEFNNALMKQGHETGLSLGQTEALAQSMAKVAVNGGDTTALFGELNTILAGLSGSDLEEAVSILSNVEDWTSKDDIDRAIDSLRGFGIAVENDVVKELYKAAKAMRAFNAATVEAKLEKLAEVDDILSEKAEDGSSTYTAEEMKKLVEKGLGVDQFVRVGYDEYVLLEPIDNLRKALEENTTALLEESITDAKESLDIARQYEEAMNSDAIIGGTSKTFNEILTQILDGSIEPINLKEYALKNMVEILGFESSGLTREQMFGLIKENYSHYENRVATQSALDTYQQDYKTWSSYNNIGEANFDKIESSGTSLALEAYIQQNQGLEIAAQRAAKEIDTENKNIKVLKGLIDNLTVKTDKINKSFKKLTGTISEQSEVLRAGTAAGSDYYAALSKTAQEATEVFGMEVSTEFVEQYKDLFIQLAQGGPGAQSAYQALGKKLVDNFVKGFKGEEKVKLQNAIDEALDYGATVEVGSSFDATPIFNTLKAVVGDAEQAAQILQGLGYSVTFKTVWKKTDEDGQSFLYKSWKEAGPGAKEVLMPIATKINAPSPSGGGGSSNNYENGYDRLHNILQEINDTLRERERLERQYQRLLNQNLATAEQLSVISQQNIAGYQFEISKQKDIIAGRLAQIEGEKLGNPDLQNLIYTETGRDGEQSIRINWEGLQAIKDADAGERTDEYYDRIQGWLESIYEAQTAIEEAKDAIYEEMLQGKDEYLELEEQVKEAIINERQKEIDKLSAINDSINDTNAKLIESLQTSLEEQRQDRENQKTEDELTDKQRRLAYLQQDTSGANAKEILQLQKEIEEGTESYTDRLIDQKISELQQQNDKAAEQRQQQIDILQATLDKEIESGELWKEVGDLIKQGTSMSGGLTGERLETILKSSIGFKGMSEIQQMDWLNETNNLIASALKWLASDKAVKTEGAEIKFKIVSEDGKESEELIGTVNKRGQVETEDGIFNKVVMNANGEYKTFESLEEASKNKSQADRDSTKPEEIAMFPYGKPSQLSKQPEGSEHSGLIKALQHALNIASDGKSALTVDGTWGLKTSGATYTYTSGDSWSDRMSNLEAEVKKKFEKLKNDGKINLSQYKTGGLADFTGPAWLDGTKSRPEYILNADQTKAFFNLVDVLGSLQTSSFKTAQNSGDNTYDIDINVESIGSDYDVEQLATTVKRLINEDARYRNNNTINLTR